MAAQPSTATKLGHLAAKVLRIKLDYRNELGDDKLSRGESVFSAGTGDSYVEREPTSAEWVKEVTPDAQVVKHYILSLFPFVTWLPRYNTQWLIGDLVAGITVGAVVVPQSMAYAALARLPPEFGLYSAFMGVMIYWLFATSKDITIGPVAVMSTIVGNIIDDVQANGSAYQPYQIASALAIICGAIVTFLGLTRLGFIVELISLATITSFITGSAINIGVGQFPGLIGIPSTVVNNRASTYLVVIHSLQHLGSGGLAAAIGCTALVMLYLIRFVCNTLAKRYPQRRKLFFFLSTLRTAFVILLYTLISWLVNRNTPHTNSASKAHFKILGHVPRGFQDAGAPTVNITIIKEFASKIPVSVIVLLIEHISISKSFGRINGYKINPSQELLAIGITNLFGPFVGAYPATGSFSRTAIKSKAGVRTPLAGVITGIVVLLAIYALPAVFYYIPTAALSAVIIHAVGDLIVPPNTVYQFWRVSPIEVFIFFAGVIVTVFSSIENGVYVTLCVSAGLYGFRLLKAKGRFLGKVKVRTVVGEIGENHDSAAKETAAQSLANDADLNTRNVYLPLNKHDGTNPEIDVVRPYPGIFIYKFSEAFNYPNAAHYLDGMVDYIFEETRRTNPHSFARPGDRPWNDPGPKKGQEENIDYSKPTLKAVILDFSSVNNVDITSVQTLVDVRNQLDRYATPTKVEWHIASIQNRWTKRALASAGFGYPTPEDTAGEFHRWKPLYSVAEIGGQNSAAQAAERRENERRKIADLEQIRPVQNDSGSDQSQENNLDQEITKSRAYSSAQPQRRVGVVQSLNRPFFHIDISSALQSAIAGAETRGLLERDQAPPAYSAKASGNDA